jgi:hypothetical protein
MTQGREPDLEKITVLELQKKCIKEKVTCHFEICLLKKEN